MKARRQQVKVIGLLLSWFSILCLRADTRDKGRKALPAGDRGLEARMRGTDGIGSGVDLVNLCRSARARPHSRARLGAGPQPDGCRSLD